MTMELSRSISRETQRSRPVRGGKSTCCWSGCDEPHAAGSGYCPTHKAEYMRAWRKAQAEELKRLRALAQAQEGAQSP
jgi:hypothetical protein